MKKKSLLLTAVATLGLTAATMAQNVPSYVPTNGLVGWWPFNGNANDESGNGNNGTVNGATFSPDRFNNLNAACNLNNQAGDNIAIPTINFGNDFTISLWFNLIEYNQNQASSFFSQKDANNGIELNYTINPNILLYSLIGNESDPTKRMYSLYSIDLANWNHLVWIKNGNQSAFYINGMMVYQQNNLSSTTINNGTGYFGRAQWGGNEFYGLMDDVGFWDRALTDCEMVDLYNAQVGSLNSSSTQTQTALDSYTWPVNNQTYTQSGTYTAVIPNAVGCDSTITLDLTLNFTGIDEQVNSKIIIAPNPTSDYFMVSASEELIGEAYSIIDLNGKILMEGTLTQKEQKIEIGNLSEGMYMFKINNETEQTFRLIKN